MANKRAILLIDGPNKTRMQILVTFNDAPGGALLTWQRMGIIDASTRSFSGDYYTANYPAFIMFKDNAIGSVFALSGFQNDSDPRFPFNEKSNGEGTCLTSNFEVHQGSLTWKVTQIL